MLLDLLWVLYSENRKEYVMQCYEETGGVKKSFTAIRKPCPKPFFCESEFNGKSIYV